MRRAIGFELAFVLLGGASVSLSAQASAATRLVVPPDLFEYSASLGCAQISDFFADRPGVLEPPYVYVDPTRAPWLTAAAVWCQRPGSDGYSLLVRLGDGDPTFSTCPSEIAGQSHIGGLSTIEAPDLALNFFVYVDDPGQPGPPIPVPLPAIRSEYDGVGQVMACFEGRWLVHHFH